MTVEHGAPSAALEVRTEPVDRVIGFVANILCGATVPSADARQIAVLMVEADLVGASSHGVFRLPEYVKALRGGLVNPAPSMSVERRGGAVALIDGDNGMGHLAAAEAVRVSSELARESGVGWAGVRRSNHSGAGSIYAAMLAEQGLIGIYAAVAAANHMAPWGGSEPMLGTNPLAIAVPGQNGAPFVIDMATSVGSFGAIKNHALRGEALPEGWMINRETGAPLTDPAQISLGLLAPLGGHKGSGLAIAIGLLAGVLNGGGFGRDIRSFDKPATKAADVGQLVIAVDPGRFMSAELFETAVARHMADIAAVRPMPGVDHVRWPGERRARVRAERMSSGIPIDHELRRRLHVLAEELKIQPLN